MANNNLDNIAMLPLFMSFLNILNYGENLKQSSNDDLLQGLKIQDDKYLSKILENQEEILRRLERNGLQ